MRCFLGSRPCPDSRRLRNSARCIRVTGVAIRAHAAAAVRADAKRADAACVRLVLIAAPRSQDDRAAHRSELAITLLAPKWCSLGRDWDGGNRRERLDSPMPAVSDVDLRAEISPFPRCTASLFCFVAWRSDGEPAVTASAGPAHRRRPVPEVSIV